MLYRKGAAPRIPFQYPNFSPGSTAIPVEKPKKNKKFIIKVFSIKKSQRLKHYERLLINTSGLRQQFITSLKFLVEKIKILKKFLVEKIFPSRKL